MFHDLLLEIGVEELPSGAVLPLAEALTTQIIAGLATANLSHGEVSYFATPRRLAVLVRNLITEQPEQHVVKRGPSITANENAIHGFAASCGVSVNELTTLTTDKGQWWMYDALIPGTATILLLPKIIENAATTLPIAKPMRWGNGDFTFARPVHWILCLFGEEIVPATIFGQVTGRQTFGHRFHHPAAIDIQHPLQYEPALHDAYVIASFATRRNIIIEQIKHLAGNYNAIMPDALLDEVTSIVEWPHAVLANIDPVFLDVPSEALIAAMQVHQKCFALRDTNAKLLPAFITVANIQSVHPTQVQAGNERVMHARLSDAAFFYHQDQKQSLSSTLPALATMIFQEKLGTLADKTARLQRLMQILSPMLQLDTTTAERAAMLSKCDLLSGMVGEFPELQGIMGSYYALIEGESPAVAEAIREHYLPRFAADELPVSPVGLALALAERIDTLVGIFAIGLNPRGVKDPFKLRRHAQAVIRLLIAMQQPISLSTVLSAACNIYSEKLNLNADTVVANVKRFILERLPSYYQTKAIDPSVVLAVRSCEEDRLFDMDQRIQAVLKLLQSPNGRELSALSKRVGHLLSQANFDNQIHRDIDAVLLTDPAEKTLYEHLQSLENRIQHTADYAQKLTDLATLSSPIADFFAQVMVMVDDLQQRQNRLCLLKRIQNLVLSVADLSHLVLESK